MNRLTGRVAPSWLLRAVALVLLAWVGSSGVAAWQLVARPQQPFAEPLPGGLVAADVRLATRDGEELGAWFHAGDPGRAVAVLLHGLGGSRSTLGPAARRLAENGQGFLALSLRSFGDSSGEELDFGWSSRADVIAAVEYVERAKPDAPIVVVGQSLGAAAAIFAAPELGRRVSGYVLEAPYHDLDKACRDRLSQELIPPFSWAAYAGLRLWASLLLPTELARLRPIDQVEHFPVDLPVLFVAGTEDREAPVEDVVELCGRCRGKGEIAILDGRDHDGLWRVDQRHWELWQGFLAAIENPVAHLDPR